MVEEVVCLRTDLQLHAFPDGEVLEDGQIRIEECWAVGDRKQVGASLARYCGSGKAVRVYVDMRARICWLRVAAGIQRIQRLVAGSQDGLIVNGDTLRIRRADRTRDNRTRLEARDPGSLFRCRSHAGNGHVVVDIRPLVTDVAAVGKVRAAL